MFPIQGYGFQPNMPMQPQPSVPNQAWPNAPFQPNFPQMMTQNYAMPMGKPNMHPFPQPPFANISPMPQPNMPWQPIQWQQPKYTPQPHYNVQPNYNMPPQWQDPKQAYYPPNSLGNYAPNQFAPQYPNAYGYPNPNPIKQDPGKPENTVPTPNLSGAGSIRGTSFKSADGERWEAAVKAGKTYNILSDKNTAINASYASIDGSIVMDKVGMFVGGKYVTFAADGTFKINGDDFKKGRNDLDGKVVLKGDEYTITSDDGYKVTLKAGSSTGVSINIEGENVTADRVAPDGLWGATFDGEKLTESELKRNFAPSDYEIDSLLTFDFEDNNKLGKTPSINDATRNQWTWDAENPYQPASNQTMTLSLTAGNFNVNGPNATGDDLAWTMAGLKSNRVYNVFSDENIQVNGQFTSGIPQKLGFVINGEEVEINQTGTGASATLTVKVNGTAVTSYDANGIKFDTTNGLTITSDNDEGWKFTANKGANGLDFTATASNIAANSTRSSGLLGDAIGANRYGDNGNDANGAGYLRDEDGLVTKAGQSMTNALAEYEVDDLLDTNSGRSVYDN